MLNDILEYAKSVTDNLEDVYNMDIDSIKEMLVSAKDDVKQSVKQSVVKKMHSQKNGRKQHHSMS